MQQPPYHSPPRPTSYTVRPQRMDGWTRILIVGGTAALVSWFAVSYIRGDTGSPGGQSIGVRNHSGIEPRDVFGFRQSGDQAGGMDGYGRADGEPRQRYRYEPDTAPLSRQPTRQWRLCRDDRPAECGPWRDGPPPRDRRR